MGVLRFVLAMIVVLAHLGGSYRPMSGGLAVQAFFIISGFYIALILDGKYKSVPLFYSNRLLRLLPTYYAVLALSAVALFAFDAGRYVTRTEFIGAVREPLTAFSILFSNLFIVGQDVFFWFNIDGSTHHFIANPRYPAPLPHSEPAWHFLLVPQAWSLALEFFFYTLAPFLVGRSWKTILALAVASFALRWAGHLFGMSYDVWPRRFFPAEIGLFLCGVLAYKFRDQARFLPHWAGYAALAALVIFLASYRWLPFSPAGGRFFLYAIVTIACPVLFQTFRRSSLDGFIGNLSYPIYICHILVIALVAEIFSSPSHLVSIAAILVWALCLYWFIERPVDRWRQLRVAMKDG
jgi:peptidoglycan/LPS O-acetylase OafA/YrhL